MARKQLAPRPTWDTRPKSRAIPSLPLPAAAVPCSHLRSSPPPPRVVVRVSRCRLAWLPWTRRRRKRRVASAEAAAAAAASPPAGRWSRRRAGPSGAARARRPLLLPLPHRRSSQGKASKFFCKAGVISDSLSALLVSRSRRGGAGAPSRSP
jgi:hypothetical protein